MLLNVKDISQNMNKIMIKLECFILHFKIMEKIWHREWNNFLSGWKIITIRSKHVSNENVMKSEVIKNIWIFFIPII
jgi:hypothetical protein